MRVPYSYLERQFAEPDPYLEDIRTLVSTGNFTLGEPLETFEKRFATLTGMPYAIGVASGTDALILSLAIVGIQPGDEVITTTNSFIATVGAIVSKGAIPVFVDNEDGFVIDATKIEAAITPRTRAIIPVHNTGNVCDMPAIMAIAKKHNLMVIEDACQSICAMLGGKPVGSWGETACFSLHPLKNLNVWGDGGVIVTRSKEWYEKLRLYRNHGLKNRDEVQIFGLNSRLHTLQAAVGNRIIDQAKFITDKRIEVAGRYDKAFADLKDDFRIPVRRPDVKHVCHLYMVRVRDRDELLKHLHANGVEAKIHYPIPTHLQEAAKYLGYKKGDFPIAEEDSRTVITLPAHQHLTDEEIDYTIQQVRSFYGK